MTPPRLLTALIESIVPESDRASVLGDLQERFGRIAAQKGASAARRWYARETLGLVSRVVAERAILAPLSRLRRGLAANRGGWRRDLVHAVHALRRRPGFALPLVLIFAVAISANTVVFGIVDAVLLEPLPYSAPDRLVMIWDVEEENPSRNNPISYARYEAIRTHDEVFDAVGAFESFQPAVRVGEFTERVNAATVSADTWRAFGVQPLLGRTFTGEEDRSGGAPVAVISHRYWTSRFGSDPSAVGRTLTLDGKATEIIGVMPEGFWFHDPYMFARSTGARENARFDLWTPLESGRDWASEDWRDYPALRLIAQLDEGTTVETAGAVMTAERGGLTPERGPMRATVVPLTEEVGAGTRAQLLGALLTAALVLLIACANVGGMMFARHTARRGELSVRVALGASPWEIGRLLMAESLVLALVGSLVGLAAAGPLMDLAIALTPRDLPLIDRIDVDPRVVAFTLLVGVAAGVLASLPSLVRHGRLREEIASSSRTVTTGRTAGTLRSGLVVLQVAVTLLLLVPTTAMVRHFAALAESDPGFEARAVTTFQLLPVVEDGDFEAAAAVHARLAERLREAPGVSAVGGVSSVPFGEWYTLGFVRTPGAEGDGMRVRMQRTLPGYFEAMEIPLLRGRSFGPEDRDGAESVAIVSRELFERLSAENPDVDRLVLPRATMDRRDVTVRIVGVADDVKYAALTGGAEPVVYVPQAQLRSVVMQYVVKADLPFAELSALIRRTASAIDPDLPVHRIERLEYLVAQSLHRERSLAQMMGLLGTIAVMLAILGIHGTVAYTAGMRLPEIGLRKAFGAAESVLLTKMLWQGLAPVAVGIAAGWVGTIALRGLAESALGELPPLDPLSYGFATVMLLSVAVVATLGPVRRAVRVEPMGILKQE